MVAIRWQDAIDFVTLTIAIYVVIRWAKEARALRVAVSIVGLHVASMVASHFDLIITGWVLDGAAIIAILSLLLVFQPELRRALMRVDTKLRLLRLRAPIMTPAYRAIATAVFAMAKARTGCLIVLVGRSSIGELTDGGVTLGAQVTAEILEAIFQKASPVHDGAAIIEGDHIVRTGVILPLTQRLNVPGFFGTRHRAALGLAERSDALVLVVSEERGEVRMMRGREVRWIQDLEELVHILEGFGAPPKRKLSHKLTRILTGDYKFKLAAVGLAVLVWVVSFLGPQTTIRTISVPIQFVDVPAGLDISRQSATKLEIQIRGSSWLMAHENLTQLVASFNLSKAKTGLNILPVRPDTVDLPPGVVIEAVTPRTVSVRLTKKKEAQSLNHLQADSIIATLS